MEKSDVGRESHILFLDVSITIRPMAESIEEDA